MSSGAGGSNYDQWMSKDDNRKILYIIYGYNPNKMADYYKVKIVNKTIKKSICNEEYFIHFYDQFKGVEENIKFYDEYGNDITNIIRNYK